MKKAFVLSAILLVSISGAVFALRFAAVRPAGPPDDALRLGATIPLTGVAATYGDAIRKGIELASAELTDAGIRHHVSYEDVNLPGPQAVSAIRRLADDGNIEVLVGNFFNNNMPIMASTIMKEKIVSFHTAEADDMILDAGDYIFSTNAKIRDEAAKMAALAKERFNAQTAAVLYVGTNWGEQYNLHFSRAFEALGGSVVYSELTALEERDVRTPMMKASAANPDVIVTAYFGPTLGIVLKTAFELRTRQPIIGTYETEDPSVLKLAGSVPDNRVYFFTPEGSPSAPSVKRFHARFAQRFGSAPSIFSENAYDATLLAARALIACNRERECARSYVAQTRNHEGASGTFTIDHDGAATKSLVLKTIAGGEFVAQD